jgi:hypothetical protein
VGLRDAVSVPPFRFRGVVVVIVSAIIMYKAEVRGK